MARVPKALRPYFDALRSGFEAMLPPERIANRAFLLNLQEAVEAESRLTAPDLQHLKTLMQMAERVAFPPIRDVQTVCEAEAYLFRVCPPIAGAGLCKKQIRLTLQWAFLLLARQGRVSADLLNVSHGLRLWRRVQAFHPIEQGFIADFIRWMQQESFSDRSMVDIVREVHRFRQWMKGQGLASFGQVGNLELQRYILDRACGQQNGSKQRIIGHIKALLYYYQDAIDGGYLIPDYAVRAPRLLGVNVSASSEEIDRLWEALLSDTPPDGLTPESGLMLILILGYGLSLKALPLLELMDEPGTLFYTAPLPCRRGSGTRQITLDLAWPALARFWHGHLKQREEAGTSPDVRYLFTSGHGVKRKRPVSVEYCQRAVQAAVQGILGYPISVNHLERGALKRLAHQHTIMSFMMLTAGTGKSRLARMFYWLTASRGELPRHPPFR